MAKEQTKNTPPLKIYNNHSKWRRVSLAQVIFLEPSNFWEPTLEVEVKNDFLVLMGDFLTSLLLAFCWQKASKTVV